MWRKKCKDHEWATGWEGQWDKKGIIYERLCANCGFVEKRTSAPPEERRPEVAQKPSDPIIQWLEVQMSKR